MILAIDFDGTLMNDKAVPPGHRMGAAMPGAKEALVRFKARGDTVIVFCVWANSEKNIQTIDTWMNYFEIPYDVITNVKPPADYFVDNKGVYFQTWKQTLEEIDGRSRDVR